MFVILLTFLAVSLVGSFPMKTGNSFLCAPCSTLLQISIFERDTASPILLLGRRAHSSATGMQNHRRSARFNSNSLITKKLGNFDGQDRTIRSGSQGSGSGRRSNESFYSPVLGLNTSGNELSWKTLDIDDNPLRGSRRGIVSQNTLAQARALPTRSPILPKSRCHRDVQHPLPRCPASFNA